jgi:hypothetical protein
MNASFYTDRHIPFHKTEIDQALENAEQRLDAYFEEHPEADEVRQRIIARSQRK